MRYKGKEQVLQLVKLTSMESVLDMLCERWGLVVSYVRMKFAILDTHKIICSIYSKVDFQLVYHIYHMFNNSAVNFIINAVEGMVDILLGSLLLS